MCQSTKGSRDQKFENHFWTAWNLEEKPKEETVQLHYFPGKRYHDWPPWISRPQFLTRLYGLKTISIKDHSWSSPLLSTPKHPVRLWYLLTWFCCEWEALKARLPALCSVLGTQSKTQKRSVQLMKLIYSLPCTDSNLTSPGEECWPAKKNSTGDFFSVSQYVFIVSSTYFHSLSGLLLVGLVGILKL